MKTPNPDVDPFVEALRGDLPCAADEARVRARLLAAGVVVTGAALSSSSAGASLAGSSLAGSSLAGSSLAGSSLAGSSLGPGTVAAAAGTMASGTAASGAAGGAIAGAPALLVKAGVLSKVLVLPVAAKVGVAATLAMAVAATSVPLVLERHDAPNDARVARTEPSVSPGARETARAPVAGNAAVSVEATPGSASPARAYATASEAVATGAVATGAATTGAATTGAATTGAATTGAARRAPAAARTGSASAASRSAAAPSLAAPPAAVPRARVRADGTETNGAQPSGAPAAARPDATAASTGGRTELVVSSSLAEEARLIEQAMLALGGGQHDIARRSLEEHARRFPAGLLGRERERALARLRRATAQHDAQRGSEHGPTGSSR